MKATSSSQVRARRILLWMALTVIFCAPIAVNIYDHLTRQKSGFPDEKTAIMQLLASKFAGPSYFQPDRDGVASALSPDRVYILTSSALVQSDRVAGERKLNDEFKARLRDLILKISEPSPSRAIGETRVNLLLLNIALDTLT